MRTLISIIGFLVLVLGTGVFGDTVELPLNCAGTYGFNSYWQTNFDLGVTFSEISHVYIDWSGEITAGLAVNYTDPCNPFPLEVGINAYLGANPWPRLTEVWGGGQTYPSPEPFDTISRFSLSQTSSWSDLLDGQGNIRISHVSAVRALWEHSWYYIDYGSVMLDDSTLIVEGTVTPEPASLLLLGAGFLGLILKGSRK